ncbi:aldo/keto reductase [Actinomyces israelii]|uniref:Aldo/keto reductase n=1 Tax=Actinomyces israelii TaxID=1659 RepID=A0ABT4IA63_9ACTO|nr:aldo/keto reductase [Actinomyces israelii]MCZ0858244.1 aldo/keto reductase [Actinomyces israelii]
MNTVVPTPPASLIRGTNESAPLQMPQLGLGTYKVGVEQVERVVRDALDVGYRHIDTAQMYRNEAGVGAAIACSGVPRDQLWVTSKLNNPNHRRDDALRSFEATMRDLRLDVLDLFLIHWPMADSPGLDLVDTWRTMIEILESGRVRAIGVSNFQADHLRTIIEATGVTPAVNQIELHPYLSQEPLRALHSSLGVVTESWSPLGRGRLLDDPVVVRMAAALGVTPTQIVIRWHLQHDLVVIPKTTHRERMVTNADVFSFALSDGQMAALDALDRGLRTGSHPDRVQEV